MSSPTMPQGSVGFQDQSQVQSHVQAEVAADAADASMDNGTTAAQPAPPVFPLATRIRHGIFSKLVVPVDCLVRKPPRNAFGILAYHRVSPNVPAGPTLCVAPTRFEQQIGGLIRRGYQPMALRTLWERMASGEPTPRGAFVICFDDGYEGVFRHALPVLQKFKAPATVFLPTGHIGADGPRPFDPWGCQYAGAGAIPEDAWKIMTLDQCRQLQESGLVELGCHTHMHENMQGRPDAFADDMASSVQFLRNELGVERPLFSYPFGMTGPEMRRVVRDSGVVCGLTTDCQLVTQDVDPFNWGRLGAEQYDTHRTLRAKLNGTYSRIQNAYRWLKQRVGMGPPAHLRNQT